MFDACAREQAAKAERESAALRAELCALDPELFEEVEDLKWAHHVLARRCAEYEGLVTGLAAELGRAPPAPSGAGLLAAQ